MKVILFKDNNQVDEVDLSLESRGLDEDVSYLMGRSQKCHLVLDDHQVSREHIKIDFKGGDWFLNLLSDYGGLIVNGSPTQDKKIDNGDIAKVGPFTIHFYIPPKVIETPEPAPAAEPQPEEEKEPEKEESTEVTSEEPSDGEVEKEEEGFGEESSDDDTEDSFGSGEDSSEGEFSDNNDDEYGNGDGDDEYGSNSDSDEYGSDDEYGDSGGGFDSDDEGGGFGDDEGDDDFGGGDDDSGTLVFSSFAKYELELFGEYAPYDKFILEDPEVFIGRDPEKCKIVIQDPEVSSVHAVIKKNNITCSIEDLKSANGTILNGERINKSVLSNNDEFIIGGTTFTVKVVSELLDQESDRLMPVEENQEIEIEEVVEVDSSFGEDGDGFGGDEEFEGEGGETFGEEPSSAPEEKSLIKRIMKDPAKRKKAIIYGVAAAAVGLLLYEPAPTKKKVNRRVISKKAPAKKTTKKTGKKSYSEETRAFLTSKYQLAEALYNKKDFERAIREFDLILEITDGEDWNNTLFYKKLAQQNLAKLEEEVRKLEERKENEIRKAKVKELVDKAKDAVDKMESMRAEGLFSKILELEPDNFDVPQLRIELESKAAEIREKEAEEQRKREVRAEKVDALKPGETLFLQKIWYKAIARLEQFMKIDDMDEDLLKKAAEMLAKSKKELDDAMEPLQQKVERLKEGQDLKGAYDILSQMNELDPTDEKVLNEMASIRETLELRARKIYREGLIAESLSLFQEAKEKFEDVKGTAPIGSSYYNKAIDKLKEY